MLQIRTGTNKSQLAIPHVARKYCNNAIEKLPTMEKLFLKAHSMFSPVQCILD